MSSLKPNLTENSINLGLYINSPMAEECSVEDLSGETPSCYNAGLASKFFALCLRYAGQKYNLSRSSSDLGVYDFDTNSWTGLFGRLSKGEIDSIVMFTYYSELRARHFSYTRFFYETRYVFLIKNQDVQPSQGALLLVHGFSLHVWIALLSTMIALLISFVFLNWSLQLFAAVDANELRRKKLPRIFGDTFWKLLRFVFLQGENRDNRSPADRSSCSSALLLIFLSALTVVMINVYQNVVYNQISTNLRRPPFRNTQELASLIERGRLTLVTNSRDVIYFDYVNNSDHAHFRSVRRALRANPLRVTASIRDAVRMLESGRGYVFVAQYLRALRLASDNCDIAVVDLDTPTFWAGFVVNKNRSRLLRQLDEAVVGVQGRLQYFEQELENRYSRKCLQNELNPMTLNTLSGVFLTYCGFVATAVICFGVERLLQKTATCGRRQNN